MPVAHAVIVLAAKCASQCIKFILEKFWTARILRKLDFVIGNTSEEWIDAG
jgi:hypothetical protein